MSKEIARSCSSYSSASVYNERKEIHPLCNPIILRRIFSLVQLNTLKNSRLVCKLWDKIATPHLQSNSQVVLIRGKELDKTKYSYRNFISYIEKIPQEEIFFRNYHIEHWILNEKREKSLVKFWKKCGLCMKHLHLRDIIFYEIETIRNVLYHWTPNLESIIIEDCLFYTITQENIPSQCEEYWNPEDFDEEYVFFDYYDHVTVEQLKKIDKDTNIICNPKLQKLVYGQLEEEAFPLAWEEIFLAFPNIKELRISACTPAEQCTEILEHLSHVRSGESSSCANVEIVSFFKNSKGFSLIDDSHLQQLSELSLTLSSLEITYSNPYSEGLLKLLSRHCKTLKYLFLSLIQESDSPEDNSTRSSQLFTRNSSISFLNLRQLRISLRLVEDSFVNTLQRMPKLQRIELWDSEDDFNWDTSADEIIINDPKENQPGCYPSINEFSCGYLLKSEDFFRTASCYFINLKILKASLTDIQIRVVFSTMKSLEEITVFDRYLTDAGISGIPVVIHDRLEWSPRIQRQHSYIGDLKNLKRFILKYWKYEAITDISVYHGFMDVVNLGHLHLTITGISDTAIQDLAFKSSLITLISPTASK